jgi:phospholipid N-methyltransferase
LNNLNFFKEAFSSLKTSGTVLPSSKHLVKEILKPVDFKTAKVIVEFGPGNGNITKAILKKLEPKAVLIAFEINDSFYNALLKIKHPQLHVVNASALEIITILENLGFSKVDYVISSLPLTNIPKTITDVILKNTHTILKTDGLFVQYQYSLTYFKTLKKVFNNQVALRFEVLNIPPAFIYTAKK